MIERISTHCLIRPENLDPSQDDLVVAGVFNPGATVTSDGIVLLVRVAESVRARRSGFVGLPRWDVNAGRVSIDWIPEREVNFLDQRVVRMKRTGTLRLTFTSHLRTVWCGDGRSVDRISPALFVPTHVTEEFGVEDPRVTRIGERFFVTYVAVSRHGVATALASTDDFDSFERHGIIFCPENKDVVLFPDRVGGTYRALHRPVGAHSFSPPEIWLASSDDLLNWGNHQPLLGSVGEWDAGRIGAGAPPIRTSGGWLEIYHGSDRAARGRGIGVYSAGALLLDLEDPSRVIGLKERVVVPQMDFETSGFVPDVIFPTGIVEQGETILLYYGAADTVTCVVVLRTADLIDH